MLSWLPSEEDRLAEVDHVDGRRRPWRAGLTATVAAAVVLAGVPWPPSGVAVGVAAGSAVLAAVAAWRFPIVRSRRGHAAARSAEISVAAAPSAITVWRAGLERRLAPEAVERLVVGVDHVFLHLAEAEVLTIPCRAFGSERGGLDRFVVGIDRFRRGGRPLDDGPEPDRADWALQYGLRGVGLGWSNARGGDLERLVLVVLAVGASAVVLAASEAWRQAQDLALLAILGVLGAVMVGVSRRRAPVGPIDLAVGPAGGWMRSRSGSIRFGWDQVLGVEVDPRMVVLRLADRVVPVPAEAFEHEPARLRFVGDVRGWWRAARAGSRQRPPPRDAGPLEDPFAPPRDD